MYGASQFGILCSLEALTASRVAYFLLANTVALAW